MAPIHDTDLAEERWSKAEWSNYELWEKVEHRFKRRRRLWIIATLIVFLGLSAVPIVIDHSPRWKSLSAIRMLALEINHMKREASVEQVPYRIVFPAGRMADYRIEKTPSCGSRTGTEVRTGKLLGESNSQDYVLVDPEHGKGLGIPGLVLSFCYDPIAGAFFDPALAGRSTLGFAVAPAKDLTAQGAERQDRFAILLLNGPSAEVSF